MGATTTQGTGPGEALGKGPRNNRNMYVPLLSPHVVTAGVATLVSGTVTVTFPKPLLYSKTRYVTLVTSTGANPAFVTTITDVSSQFASFVITGTSAQVINYVVILAGAN